MSDPVPSKIFKIAVAKPTRKNWNQHRAVGIIYGRYIPSADSFDQGVLITANDGVLIPAHLSAELTTKLQRRSELLESDQDFLVHPQSSLETPQLTVELFRVRLLEKKKKRTELSRDLFNVRCFVVEQKKRSQIMTVRVYNNEALKQNPRTRKYYKHYIYGLIENYDNNKYQLWNLLVKRSGMKLVLQYYEPVIN